MKSSWNSTDLIGNARERFGNLEHYNIEWHSFYNGWIEGRFAMLKETGIIREDDEMNENEFKTKIKSLMEEFKELAEEEKHGYFIECMNRKYKIKIEILNLITQYLGMEKFNYGHM
jgi:hypothetical protein